MKFLVGDYEIEIKAKRKWNRRTSKDDTMYFMNELAGWLFAQANEYEDFDRRNNSKLSEMYYKRACSVVEQLEKMGLYEK